MVESLASTWALSGIEFQQLVKKIKADFVNWAEEFLGWFLPDLTALLEQTARNFSNFGEIICGRSSDDLHHFFEVVDGRVAVEERVFRQNFSEDASDAPHISFLVIAVGAEQNFGSSVPLGGNSFGEHVAILAEVVEMSGQAKICKFELALGGKQEVGGFEISVQDMCRVKVVKSLKELIEDILLVNLLEFVLVDGSVEVGAHVFKHQVDVSAWGGGMNLAKFDDVGVIQLLKDRDLAIGPLSIGVMLEGFEDLLESVDLRGAIVGSYLPDMSVGPWTKFLEDFVLGEDVLVYLLVFTHQRIIG
jgi:hypothetical protein